MKRSALPRFLAASLAACFILLTASCGDGGSAPQNGGNPASDGGNSVETEAVTEVTTTTALSTIPEKDFEGRTFKAVSTNQDNRHVDIVAEEENGATLNDLVYYRNRAVEESFNVTMEASDMASPISTRWCRRASPRATTRMTCTCPTSPRTPSRPAVI